MLRNGLPNEHGVAERHRHPNGLAGFRLVSRHIGGGGLILEKR
jgi:hypothetical protein